MKKAVVIFSGGRDSTICLFWAKKRYSYIEAIIFDYGQKAVQEIHSARKICNIIGVPQKVFFLNTFQLFSDSKLLSHNEKGNHSYFLPNRNLVFLSLASAYAYQNGITDIIFGAMGLGDKYYSDTRETFCTFAEKTLSLSLGKSINIVTPLLNMEDHEIWELAKSLNCYEIVEQYSYSCDEGVLHGCGECMKCKRKKYEN